MRRILLPTTVLLLLAAMLAPVASAGMSWCESDPLVKFTTPAGNQARVHVTNGIADDQYRKVLKDATITWQVEAATASTTRVDMQVTIPCPEGMTGVAARSAASSQPWGKGLLDSAEGVCGDPMLLAFVVDQP